MTTHRVSKSDKSQKGKPRVFFDGRESWADAYYLGARVEAPPLGAIIDAQTSSKTFEDGKTIWFLNAWKPVNGNFADTIAAQAALTPPHASPAPKTQLAGWAIDAGDCSRLLSNVLASSIAAGLIKTPEDMAPWVDRVYAYVNGVRSGKIVSFDDRIDWPKDEPKTGLAGSIEDGEPPYTADF